MLTLRKPSIVLTLGEIFFFFFHGSVCSNGVDFYKTRRLIQAGEKTFACVGRSIELKWRYPYSEIEGTKWIKQVGLELKILATWEKQRGFVVDTYAGFASGKLSSNGCCGLIINYVEKRDEGLYTININTGEVARKTGNTSLHVYDDCPDVSGSKLSISCDATDSSSNFKKTTDFTYRDIVDLSVSIPRHAVVYRRFFYQEQQHKIVQQPIRARCYYRKDCDVVHWPMLKKSLSLAFFSRIPYLNMTVFARLYHKKALLAELNTTFRLVDSESQLGKSTTICNNRDSGAAILIQRNPFTWNVVLSASLTFAASNFIHRISLLS